MYQIDSYALDLLAYFNGCTVAAADQQNYTAGASTTAGGGAQANST
jgi:hypothetical protein